MQIAERIAAVIERSQAFGGKESLNADNVADAIMSELGLHVEGRQLSDGAGGITTDWKTGVTTVHHKPCTLQIRWATDWVNDENMMLPLMAYVPTP